MTTTGDWCGDRTPPALQALPAGRVPWHVHRTAYLAVVLEGVYEEAGDQGRCRPEAGEAVLHLPFEGHGNRVDRRAHVMNVPLTLSRAMRMAGPDLATEAEVRSLLERCGADFGGPVRLAQPGPPKEAADELAATLLSHGAGGLQAAAERLNTPDRTLRRRFGRLYGMAPAAFRARSRARRAFHDIVCSSAPLSGVAYAHGFADQAHMCRAVIALTGAPPTTWRRLVRAEEDRWSEGGGDRVRIDRLS